MNPLELLLLLLVTSGALADVTDCVDGSTRPMTAPTEPTLPDGEASWDYGKVILLKPITAGESVWDEPRAIPVERVCMMKVNCAGSRPVNYEEPQRDEEIQDAESSEETATAKTSTSTAGTPKPTRPPMPCSVTIRELVTYEGHCVRLGKPFGGCLAGPYLDALQPPCHPPPED